MYITRPLSLFRRDPSALQLHPPEGPHSGYLVLRDQVDEIGEKGTETCCFGLCVNDHVKALPFPQDKWLTVQYSRRVGVGVGEGETARSYSSDRAFFLPVLGQPLSSNLYYVVKAEGRRTKGLVYRCSKEENMSTCCFCKCVEDVKPTRLNPNNVYQQMKIVRRRRGFTAESAASDGFPPEFLRRKGWEPYASKLPGDLKLTEANGMNALLRSKMPDFNFHMSQKGSDIVTVGEWYCPFVFIEEIGGELANVKDQIKASVYYRMTLEQRWIEIFKAERQENETTVAVNTSIYRKEALLGGVEAIVDEEKREEDGVVLMRGRNSVGGLTGIGLSAVILEKMRSEQMVREGEEEEVRVVKDFDCEESDQWKEFGCYVLSERYILRRADGSMVFTCSFRHPHQIRPKWE